MNNIPNLSEYLNQFLANVKTAITNQYNFHWNIVGPFFGNIHEKTQEYYEKLELVYDEVAERIKQLEKFPLTSDQESINISTIKNYPSKNHNETTVISLAIKDFEMLLNMTKQIGNLATEINDLNTTDLMTDYTNFFEKELWMLKSNLKKDI